MQPSVTITSSASVTSVDTNSGRTEVPDTFADFLSRELSSFAYTLCAQWDLRDAHGRFGDPSFGSVSSTAADQPPRSLGDTSPNSMPALISKRASSSTVSKARSIESSSQATAGSAAVPAMRTLSGRAVSNVATDGARSTRPSVYGPVGTSRLSANMGAIQSLSFVTLPEEDARPDVKFRAELKEILAESHRGGQLWGTTTKHPLQAMHPAFTNDKLDTITRQSLKFVLRPDSNARTWFEVLCTLALIHDSIAIPFTIAWEIAMVFVVLTSSISLLVWSVDIILNFTTGYFRENGEVEMDRRRIAMHYVRTWFIVDTLTVGCDWLSLGLVLASTATAAGQQDLAVANAVRLARVVRVARVFVLIRLLRNSGRALKVGRFGLSSTGQILIQVLKIFMFILWINHVFCCIWYGIGRAGYDGFLGPSVEKSWLDLRINGHEGAGAVDFANTGIATQYTTSMHWSLTQMTPGGMEIFPQNYVERIFNMCCLVFGLLFGTSLVGQISSKMVQYNMSRQVELRRMEELRRFLRENKVSAPLAVRIQQQIADRMLDKSRLSEQDVEDVGHLSHHLRTELRQEVFIPHLVRHPLFLAYGARDSHSIKDLCSSGFICFECIASGHDLFTPKQALDQAYLLLKGEANYLSGRRRKIEEAEDVGQYWSSSQKLKYVHKKKGKAERWRAALQQAHDADAEAVSQGSWLCEVALWMEWGALGNLEAIKPAEFMSVHANAVIEMLKHHPRIADMTATWCEAVYTYYSSRIALEDHEIEVCAEHSDTIIECTEEWRTFMGEQALSMLEARYGTTMFGRGKGLVELSQELKSGTCALAYEGNGEIIRITPVVAVKLMRSTDSKMLVHVASKARGTGWKPTCMLPGTKLRIGENPLEAARAVLDADLSSLVSPDAELEFHARDKEIKDSPSYGVRSVYLRSIWQGFVQPLDHSMQANPFGPLMAAQSTASPTKVDHSSSRRHANEGQIFAMDLCVVEDVDERVYLYAWASEAEFRLLKDGLMDEEIRGLNREKSESSLLTLSLLRSVSLAAGERQLHAATKAGSSKCVASYESPSPEADPNSTSSPVEGWWSEGSKEVVSSC